MDRSIRQFNEVRPLLQSHTRNQELSLVTERRENQLKLSHHIYKVE